MKNFIWGGIVFVLCGIIVWLAFGVMNQGAKENVQTGRLIKEEEFQQRLAVEREDTKKELEGKYRADRVSYGVMVKRLEREKERTKELEEQLKGVKSATQ